MTNSDIKSEQQPRGRKFARIVFLIAGIYGLLVTFPMYFLEEKMGLDNPPPITHAEYYYSFLGLVVVWQLVFLFISRDPIRWRPLMIFSILEKLTLLPTFFVLSSGGRFPTLWVPGLIIDLVLAMLFLFSYVKTRQA